MQDDAAFLPAPERSTGLLTLHQRLPTCGARTALPFRLGDALFLAVPQLARDVAGQPAGMNNGDSDIDAVVYRWTDGRFVEDERLAVPGGEDALVFAIGGDTFLATASVRTGSGPYELNAASTIWRRADGGWEPFQSVATFAAKQWFHFAFDGRDFLALAQGVTLPHAVPTGPRTSCLYEWDGSSFALFQTLDGGWGYNWAYFELGGERYLAYADHTSDSLVYRWDGTRFTPFQTIAAHGGRAFAFFEADGAAWLAFAAIDGPSTLFRWDGAGWAEHQTIGGPGGREFELIRADGALYLVRVRFIEGTPAAPKTDLVSDIHRWTGSGFEAVETFPTYGGTDAAVFETDGDRYLAVSSSLTPDVRFRQDMAIYRLSLPA